MLYYLLLITNFSLYFAFNYIQYLIRNPLSLTSLLPILCYLISCEKICQYIRGNYLFKSNPTLFRLWSHLYLLALSSGNIAKLLYTSSLNFVFGSCTRVDLYAVLFVIKYSAVRYFIFKYSFLVYFYLSTIQLFFIKFSLNFTFYKNPLYMILFITDHSYLWRPTFQYFSLSLRSF